MRKKLCIRHIFMLAILLFLISCRNEDFSNALANNKREEEFFREAVSKTARVKNGNNIVEALKEQNERSHFVSKMKDQSGLPIWDKMISFKRPKTANKGEIGEGETEEFIIPLTENDKDLSSILFVTKKTDSLVVKNIDNEKLKQEIFNTELDKDYREQLLLKFIIADNVSFSKDAVYWNIPDDLLTLIPKSTIYPQRRFTATVSTSENGGTTNNLEVVIVCFGYEFECDSCDDGAHTTHASECYSMGGGGSSGGGGGNTGGGGDGGGNSGGSGDGSSGGGGGSGDPNGGDSGNTDCGGGANRPFYKIIPCDGEGDIPFNYYYNLTKEERDWLNQNSDIAQNFENYLNSVSPYNSGLSFVSWGVGFLRQNPDVSWEQFENWFISESLPSNIMTEFLADLYNPDIVKPTKRFKNHAKINSIYNQAKTAANFKQYLQNFEPTFSVAHLLFDIGTVKNPAAQAETKEPQNYWIKITFNQNWNYANTPKIVIAGTFMHELLHANMYRELLIAANSNGSISLSLLNDYVQNHKHIELYNLYIKSKTDNSDYQHQYMANKYITTLVGFLKQVYGTQYTDVEYKTVVWMSSLKGTHAWELLPQSEKDLYTNTWNTNYWLWEL